MAQIPVSVSRKLGGVPGSSLQSGPLQMVQPWVGSAGWKIAYTRGCLARSAFQIKGIKELNEN